LVTHPTVGSVTPKEQYTFTYGLLTQRVAGYGSSTTATSNFFYDPNTLGLAQVTDAIGTTTYGAFDTHGNVLSTVVTPASGATTSTSATYNTLNEPLTRTDANGNITSDAYDTDGNMCWEIVDTTSHSGSCSSPPAGATVYTICESSTCTVSGNTYVQGDVESVTDPDGNTTTLTVDTYGDVSSSTNAAGDKTCSWFDVLSRLTETVPPNGNTSGCNSTSSYATNYTLSTTNDILTTVAPSPTGTGTVTTTNTWDNEHDLLTVTSPSPTGTGNQVTTQAWDADRELCWTLVASSASSNTCSSVPTGAVAQTYDADLNVATTTDANGNATTLAYNSLHQRISSTDALGNKTTWTLDAVGDILTTVSPKGNVSGCTGSCITSNTTTNTWDGYRDLLTTQDANGNTVTLTRDLDGNVLTQTDGSGNVTSQAWDVHSRVCWTLVSSSASSNACSSPPSGATVDTRDADGNIVKVQDPNGDDTSYGWNTAGEQCYTYRGSSSASCTSPPSGATDSTFDHDGNTLTTTLPSGAVITAAYNIAEEPCWIYQGSSSNACGSAPTGATSLTFNTAAMRTGMTDSTGSSSWTFDVQARELSYTNGNSAEVQYTLDNAGDQTKITYPTGLVVSQAFDADRQVCWIYVGTSTNACGSPPTGATDYSRDADENVTTEALPNGVNNTYSWDGAYNIAGISDGSGGSVFAANYTRNSDNLISKDTSQPSNNQYMKYTSKNQICYAGSANSNACSSPPTSSYPYTDDAAGNLTYNNGNTQAFDTKDELCWSVSGTSSNACASPPTGATTYTMSTDGSRIATVPSAGSATCNTFNTLQQLTQIQTGTGSTCTTPTTVGTYATDGDGLRMSKTVGANTTQFSWSDAGNIPQLLQETTGSNTTSYIQGPMGVVAEILPSGATDYYSRDALGSVRALTDSSGTVLNTDTYAPYGAVSASTGSTQNNLLFQGMYLDNESNLYYDIARYYDPTTAQFLSIDPAVASTMQPYSFVGSNPVNATDPSGLMIACDGGGGCGNAVTATIRNEGLSRSSPVVQQVIRIQRTVVQPQQNRGVVQQIAHPIAPIAEAVASAAAQADTFNEVMTQAAVEQDAGDVQAAEAANRPYCAIWQGNCAPIVKSASICVNASIFGGIGIMANGCIGETNGYQHGGVTGSIGVGSGLGASASVGPAVSNANNPQDYAGPFMEGGGGAGPAAGSLQVSPNGKTSVVYGGAGFGTAQGYVGGNQTGVWQWW
jgi:RHS repeat-associated protein